MPVFEYKGYSTSGKKAAGIVDADNPKAARVKLRKQGILTVAVTQDTTGVRELTRAPVATFVNRIGAKDIANFTRQLATMQEAGLTLIESLDALIEQAANVRFKKIVSGIREQVSQGSTLADALAGHPAHFDKLAVSLVRAGEVSGSLGYTLNRLATFRENSIRQKAKVTASMIYPVIMTLVGSSVLLFLLGYVVPKTEMMFEDMNQALPLPTVVLLAVSNFLSAWWPALVAAAALAAVAVYKYSKTENGRLRVDALALKLPVVGPVYRSVGVARFAGSFGVLISGGVELIQALKITEETIGNSVMANAVGLAAQRVTEGESIATPLRQSGQFPPVVTQMIAAGEKSGALDKMLEKIADSYEFEVETSISTLTSLIEPLLILAMGAVVGFIVMAILLPIFELSQMVQ